MSKIDRDMDRITAEDRLRLHVTDPDTFAFSFDDAVALQDEIDALSSAKLVGHQERVAAWMQECFGAEITSDKVERADRFIEEALELAQATGWSADRGHALVDYVFSRPIGEIGQEVGGVMVTLAALCNVFGVDVESEARREVDRITQPEIVLKIRAKQAAKPTGSALPVAHPSPVQKVQESQTVSEANEALMRERTSLIETKREQLEAQHRQHIADLSQARGETEVDKQAISDLSAKLKLAEAALEPFANFDVGPAGDGIFSIPDGHPILGDGLGDNWKPAVIVGDFRRARAALHSIRED